MLNSEENRNKVINWFPKLKDDNNFEIIGGEDPNYNCIAWVAFYDNVWWEPLPEDQRSIVLDGVCYDWPLGAANDKKLTTLIEIFIDRHYVECNNGDYEEGYRKIALYSIGDEYTHGARQICVGKDKGRWTSKIGQSFLITHSIPELLENPTYGQVKQYLKIQLS
jgi:hypothetical protein